VESAKSYSLGRLTTQVCISSPPHYDHTNIDSSLAEYKEAFALFDKRGTGFVPREQIGDLLRALGQNPTQGEVAEIASNAPREGEQK
jgi:Ca2+-binding EF-hand superfamily protein